MRDLVVPILTEYGERLSGLLGIGTDLEARLQRARISTTTVSEFRLRQAMWAGGGLGAALLAAALIRPPLPLTLFMLAAAPIMAFLVLEQRIEMAGEAQQRALFHELPIISEQLAMLLGAGYSLGSALQRLSLRNTGVSGVDLRRACDRMRQGLTAGQALLEWSDLAQLPELTRLVSVLALSSETTDLGRLVSDEARTVRREAQRRVAEVIDRRAQQVWVPVTVATLVPGVIFLVIPFLQALRLFSSN